MNKLRWMEVFVAVVDYGSFSEAAKRLDISAVMVGKMVAQMEQHLQTSLLQRNTRNQTLTEAGKAWYEESINVAAALRNAEDRIESLKRFPAGNLRITTSSTLGRCLVAMLCSQYQLDYPEVRIELDLSDRHVDVFAEGYDFAIRVGDLPVDSPLVAHRLGDYRPVIAGSPEYLLKHGTPQTIDDLKDHRCLRYSYWTKRNVWRKESGFFWPESATFSCNDSHALRQAALTGSGLILQPRLLLAEDIDAGRLIPLLAAELPEARPVHLLWRQDLHSSARHRSFIEWIKEKTPLTGLI